MCELMGMSANKPTDVNFSFSGLMQRGGVTGPHTDGWGITFYDGKGYRTFKDANACSDCPIAGFVQSCSIKSHVVISHIRKANRGRVSLENTHPFMRELWGRYWTFAHNGQIKGIKKQLKTLRQENGLRYRPVGTTDSETAFCYLLNRLDEKFEDLPQSRTRFWSIIAELSEELSRKGIFNILLSEGKNLFSYCNKELYWITRRAPFGSATLKDAEVSIDFKAHTGEDDIVTIIASNPLTRDEKWEKMKPGSAILFHDGVIIKQFS